jgi:hypothetical protein
MNTYPAKPMMDQMAQYGRYGDSMLVHMNPIEVAGIAAMSPTGTLTRNPVTGQPEAFLPLLFGALGSTLGLKTLGTAALTGVGTAAVTGDLKRGIISGLTAGLAGVAGDALELGNIAGESVAEAAGEELVGEALADTITDQATKDVIQNVAGETALEELSRSQLTELGQLTRGAAPDITNVAGVDPLSEVIGSANPDSFINQARSAVPDFLKQEPKAITDLTDKLGFGGAAAGAAIGQGTLEQMKLEEAFRKQQQGIADEQAEKGQEALRELQLAYATAQPNAPFGDSPFRSEMSRRLPPPMYPAKTGGMMPIAMNSGGSINKMGEQYNPETGKYEKPGTTASNYSYYNPFTGQMVTGVPGAARGREPVTIQAGLRGPDVVAPPRDYLAGFEPEFSYFQDLQVDAEGNPTVDPAVPDRSYRPMRQGVISRSQYFDPILQAPQANAQMNEFRRTLEKLDPGPTDPRTVMGLASEGSVLSTPQQNILAEIYNPPLIEVPDIPTEPSPDSGSGSPDQAARRKQLEDAGVDPDIIDAILRGDFTGVPSKGSYGSRLAALNPEQQAAAGDAYRAAQAVQEQGGNEAYQQTAATASALAAQENPDFTTESLQQQFPNLSPAQIAAIQSLNPTNFRVNMQDGGVTLKTSLGERTVPGGGIADIPTQYNAEAVGLPSKQEFDMLTSAILGEIDQADRIIDMFVQKYGSDTFRQIRQIVLQSVVPNSQTEGMVRGDGSGMDDRVDGMIGREQPVAVSPGEYIVPADVVSGLGEGSSDSGARQLDGMLDRVRMERNGTTQQAPEIDERKVMPA